MSYTENIAATTSAPARVNTSSSDPVDDASPENQQPTKLFIGGLSYLTSEDSLRAYFESFGEVRRTEVLRDPVTCRSRGFGFVTFVHSSSAEAVLEHGDPHELDGRTVQAKKAVPRTSVTTSPSGSDSNSSQNHKNNANSHNRMHHTNSASSDPGNGAPVIENKLFVGGLFYATGHESLRKYFEKYGEVINAEVVYNRNTKTSRGFGFVVFRDPASVDKVLSESTMHNIDGRQVEIKRCFMRQSRKGNMGHNNNGNKKGGHKGFQGGRQQGQQYPLPPGGNIVSNGTGTSVQRVLVQQPSGELRTQQMVRPSVRYYETAPDANKGGPTHVPAPAAPRYNMQHRGTDESGGSNDGYIPPNAGLPNVQMQYNSGSGRSYPDQFRGQPPMYANNNQGVGGITSQMGDVTMQQQQFYGGAPNQGYSGAPPQPPPPHQQQYHGYHGQPPPPPHQNMPYQQQSGFVPNQGPKISNPPPGGKPLTYAERLLGRSTSEQVPPKKQLTTKSETAPPVTMNPAPSFAPMDGSGIGLLRGTSVPTNALSTSAPQTEFAFPSSLMWGDAGSKDRAGSLGNLTEESASPLLASTDTPSLPSWNDWLGSAASLAIGGEEGNARAGSGSFSTFPGSFGSN